VVCVACCAACAPQRGTIGAVLGQQADGRLFLREVPAGLAAAGAGLAAEDEVLLIDGRDVRSMNAQQVQRALAGKLDDPVKLTVLREDRVLRVTLKRSAARRQSTPNQP
jgi:C-terminal processing protease CtpA/Prc